MDAFQTALAIGALVVAAITWGDWRAWLWLALGATNFVVCVLYQNAEPVILPYPMFTGLADATTCLAIYWFARQRWELWLYRVFQLSVLVSVIRLAGAIPTNALYVAALEAANWLALLVIGGSHLVRLADELGILRGLAGRALHRLDRSLFAARSAPPWGQQ